MIFELAFKVTLILACIVGLLILVLFVIKGCRIFWSAYSKRRQAWMKPLVEDYLSHGSRSFSVSRMSIFARKVLQYVLIHRSFGEKKSVVRKIASAYEQMGFADVDLRRMRNLFWWNRAEGARCLGQMRIERASPYLLRALKDRVLEVRLISAWALGRIGNPDVILPMLESLANASKIAGMRLSSTIFELGEKAVGVLTHVVAHPDPAVRLLVAHLLGELQSPKATADIIHMSRKEEDKEVRIAACKAMGTIGDRKAAPVLIKLLADEAWEIRAQAAKALGRIGVISAIAHLQRAMCDGAWWVRKNSGEALAQMKKKGIEALHKVRQDSPDRFARDMAAQWLDEIDDLKSTA